jgi:hypothetical protein
MLGLEVRLVVNAILDKYSRNVQRWDVCPTSGDAPRIIAAVTQNMLSGYSRKNRRK